VTGPVGEHPFAALVRERGGVVLAAPGDAVSEGARFAAVLVQAEEISPPVARLGEIPLQTFLVTAGFVGGREGEGSREIPAGLVARVLDAALAGAVEWEADPDFGWGLPMSVPGVEYDELLILVPRFLYARTDRPYDYAAMVPLALAARPSSV